VSNRSTNRNSDTKSQFSSDSQPSNTEKRRKPKRQRSIEDSREIQRELYAAMRRLGNNHGKVTVVALCRAPWKLPSDTLRRFNKRMHFGLPSRAGRVELLKRWFGSETGQALSRSSMNDLVEWTDGFSARDMWLCTLNAVKEPFRRVQCATSFMTERRAENEHKDDYDNEDIVATSRRKLVAVRHSQSTSRVECIQEREGNECVVCKNRIAESSNALHEYKYNENTNNGKKRGKKTKTTKKKMLDVTLRELSCMDVVVECVTQSDVLNTFHDARSTANTENVEKCALWKPGK
jgi:SpoVK/Ycf46/Vps4 family AAA+-type ATPase